MALHKKGMRPPNPEPGNYVWIDTKEGGFWRRKRGLVKTAKLNSAYNRSRKNTKICSPAASRIVQKLRPFMEGLQPGRITARICGRLRKGLNETGHLSMDCLSDFDLQPEHPISHLLQEDIHVEQDTRILTITISITELTIKRLNKLVTDYWFELVLLYGDAGKEKGLRTESEESKAYAIETPYEDDCKLSLVLPEQPWIALVKVNCLEGDEPAAHFKLYGMKVIAVSN